MKFQISVYFYFNQNRIMHPIIFFFHNESNSGFASSKHQLAFLKMAYNIVGDYEHIHFSYKSLRKGLPVNISKDISNFIEFDYDSNNFFHYIYIYNYIKKNNIKIAFGFDFQVRLKLYIALRLAGVKYIISYLGAPMSSINHGIRLSLKKLDVSMALFQPDHYIFQSKGMRDTAVYGRGIPKNNTSVVYSGTDSNLFKPSQHRDFYAHNKYNIEKNRHLVFFSGNMAERKGVDVIIQAADYIVNNLNRCDIHFLLVGNRWNQAEKLISNIKNVKTKNYITFGGYCDDVPFLLKSCSLGIIASSGWDSYPMSAVEMASSGLPLIVSDIPGLRECVFVDTGLLFPANDYITAASKIVYLVDNPHIRHNMGKAARDHVLRFQTIEHQIINLELIVQQFANKIS